MIEFRVLGPLEARAPGGTSPPLGGPRQRAVLAALLLAGNRLVTLDALVDAVWGDDPPRTARRQIQNRVSALRVAFGADSPIVSHQAGYQLRLTPDQLDATAFSRDAELAHRHWKSGDVTGTAEVCRAALRRWRGPALAGLPGPGAATDALRLEELRLDVLALRVDADLALGHHHDLIAELTRLCRDHPMRERLCAQLMTALHRDGRKSDALSTFDTARRRLREDFGLDPGPDLVALRQAILTDAPGAYPGLPPGPARPTADERLPAGSAAASRPAQLGPAPTLLVGRDAQ
ncbi:MAG: AfsR/SARP family transcriptional regulator, partial [Actinocatenispora sp.]